MTAAVREVRDRLNLSPIAKQVVTSALFVLAMLLVLVVPDMGVQHPEWFLGGAVTIGLATLYSVVLSLRRQWWRFDWPASVLSFAALAMLLLATESRNPLLLFLALGPALTFSQMIGMRGVVFGAIGAFLALVGPALLSDPANNIDGLVTAFVAALMFSALTFVHFRVTRAQREAMGRQIEVAALRDQLLATNREHVRELQQSQQQREAAESALRGVWEAVTEQAMATTDLEGLVQGWNPGAEKLAGVSAAEVEHQRYAIEFIAPNDSDEADVAPLDFATLIGSALDGGAEAAEWNVRRPDGSKVPVEVSVTARLDEHGRRIGYMFVAHDISQALAVAKLKDEFVGLISHELRTPLSSILGYLELLREEEVDGLTETQLQYLGVAERNAHRLLRLVGDLLFTAQVEAGSFRLDQSELRLAPILAGSIETAAPAAASSGVKLHAEVLEDAFVAGDPVRLGQAVDNLVSNAIKFTPSGGSVTVTLSTELESAVITVTDTGFGIPADEMDKLFGRFFRATTATNNAVPGVGLGLTITRAIVVAHHGEMGVESEEGVGTRFRITLPIVKFPHAFEPSSERLQKN